MQKVFFLVIIICFPLFVQAQLRNGWRSIYDKEGRLNSMKFYNNGIEAPDSNVYLQYHDQNVFRGIIRGKIVPGAGCQNGEVLLFTELGIINNYSIRSSGQAIYTIQRDEIGKYNSVWSDQFIHKSEFWQGEKLSVRNRYLLIENDKPIGLALYSPPVPVDLRVNFKVSVKIPALGNIPRVGLVVNYIDEKNWVLFEIDQGTHYTIIQNRNGAISNHGTARRPIIIKNSQENILSVSYNGKHLVLEINQKIETMLEMPPSQLTGKIGFMTRSPGFARFGEMYFKYQSPNVDPQYTNFWVGRGSGFIFSSDGKILTTYDVIANTQQLRVKGSICGVEFSLPAEVVSYEEAQNLAVIRITPPANCPSLENFPFGWLDQRPTSKSKVNTIGHPQAASGIWMQPSLFEGSVSASGGSNVSRLLEMSFRYGMMGAPVFDDNLNLLGIVGRRGTSTEQTETIDFFENKRTYQALMQRYQRTADSPHKDLTFSEKQKFISDIVVIIEGGLFY